MKKYILLILLVSCGVYLNSLGNRFVFDDHSIVDQNPLIRDLRNAGRFFGSSYWPESEGGAKKGLYRPLAMFSYALDYAVWKLNPFGYHLFNTLVHSLNCILLFLIASFLLRRYGGGLYEPDRAAAAASLLFSVHAVHTEAVTGIVGRAELLAGVFFLTAFLLYIKGRSYPLSLACFGLALFSKETALTLPVMIVLYDMFFVCGFRMKDMKKKIPAWTPYAVVLLCYLAIRISVLGGLGPKGASNVFCGEPLGVRILTMAKVFAAYVGLLFYPVSLCIDRRDFMLARSLAQPVVMISFIVIFSVIAALFLFFRRSRAASFALAWFLVALFPVSNIIPTGILVAERLLYLPSMGFCMLLALAMRKNEKAVPYLLVGIILFHSALTVRRNTDFRDDFTLWQRTVEKFPSNFVAHNNLGALYYVTGRFDDAIREYKTTIKLKPDYAEAYNNLGFAYKKKGMMQMAMEEYKRAIAVKPDYAAAYNSLAFAYYEEKDYENALLQYENAIRHDPSLPEAYNNRGLLYWDRGEFDRAIGEYREAVRLQPDYENARFNLANAYYGRGMYAECVKEFEEVMRINPDRADVFKYAGIVCYANLNEPRRALAYLEKFLGMNVPADDIETIREIVRRLKH